MDIAGYQDFSLVGAGGNAHVYSAAEADTGEIVAVKVLRGGGDETVNRRFERERNAMQTLKSLDHVAPVMESGVTGTGDPYLVMPLFNGGSLQQRMSEGPVPWREALELVRKVTSAIAQAHERRILHLDVKPANVLIDEDGEPYLADFGIAEAMGATSSMSAQMMTPAYTPPERLNGAKPSEHTDVYGLGGLLFALLAGEAPFVLDEGMTPAAMIVAVLNEEVRTDRIADQVPLAVTTLVSRTLSKSIDERPQSAVELGMLIDEILEDESIPMIDPIVAFRVGSGSEKSVVEAARHDRFPGEVEGSSAPAEIVGEAGEPVSTGAELFAEGELLSVSSPVPGPPVAEQQKAAPLVGLWVAAAALFVCIGVGGAITATALNADVPISGGESGSLALDEVDGAGEDSDSPRELTSTATGSEAAADVNGADVGEADGTTVSLSGDSDDDDDNDPDSDDDAVVAVEVAGSVEESADGNDSTVGSESGNSDLNKDDEDKADSGTLENGNGGTPGPTEDDGPDTDAAPPVVVPAVVSPVNSVPATPAPNDDDDDDDDSPIVVAGPTPTPTPTPIPTPTPTPTPTTAAPATTEAPVVNEPLQFEERIDIGDIGETNVRFRFTTSVATGYTVTVRSNGAVVTTQNGAAAAGVLEGVTVGGLNPGTDYSVQVTLHGPPSVTSTSVAFRTSGGAASASTDAVVLQNLRLVSAESTRFQVNYESNICANGSFVIREVGGGTVGSNAGQPDGCTTRHLAIPGFWTAALKPNTTYVITVTVEANGQGLGGGNTASQSLTVTTSG